MGGWQGEGKGIGSVRGTLSRVDTQVAYEQGSGRGGQRRHREANGTIAEQGRKKKGKAAAF